MCGGVTPEDRLPWVGRVLTPMLGIRATIQSESGCIVNASHSNRFLAVRQARPQFKAKSGGEVEVAE